MVQVGVYSAWKNPHILGHNLEKSEMRSSVVAGQVSMMLVGFGLLAYLLTTTPPTLSDGQFNMPAVILLFAALFSAVTGVGGLLAGILHRRWPALAGGPKGVSAAGLRQGMILGIAICLLAFLALIQILDSAIAGVVLILAALTETFIQNRR